MKKAMSYEEFKEKVRESAYKMCRYEGGKERVDAAMEENEWICENHFKSAMSAFEADKEYYIANDCAENRFLNESSSAGWCIGMLA